MVATDYDEGVLVGVLVGEGHFGGDGRQPHVTLRMHERHEALFRWIERTFPGGRLYGPYNHGGRRYYQWMARGAYLRDSLLPLLERRLTPALDQYAFQRFDTMRTTYRRQLRRGTGETGAPRARPPASRATAGATSAPEALPPVSGPASQPATGAETPSAPSPTSADAADPTARLFAALRDASGRRPSSP